MMSTTRLWRAARRIALGTLAALVACSGVTGTDNTHRAPGRLVVTAVFDASTISTLVVTITAPDITTPLVYNLPVSNGVATGTITIPAGSNRTIAASAFNVNDIETHHGEKTVDIQSGSNPSVQLELLPVLGDQPITVQMGNYGIVITPNPGTISLATATALQFSVAITDVYGKPITPGTNEVTWATTNPSVGRISASGLATAIATGAVQVVVTYKGSAGIANLTVTP